MIPQRPSDRTITIKNARIGFRNFDGAQGKYNAAGNRNFCVFLETDIALSIEASGWNVRWLQPRDAEEEKQAYIQVSVGFAKFPAEIWMITNKGKTQLDETTAKILDWADIAFVDLVMRPYDWDVNGKKGIKAYVKKMFVTIQEDEFEGKYIDVPDSAANALERHEEA